MIYRAFDCGIYDSREPLTTVWFEAYSNNDAGDRLQALLALAWHVEPERVFVGNVVSELEIERESIQDKAAGDRRWFEGGSWGDRPLYFPLPTLVFLTAAERRRLAKAATAAKAHAQELAEATAAEAAAVDNVREAENIRYEARRYQAFAAMPWLYEAAA